jgi:hypothetical protein
MDGLDASLSRLRKVAIVYVITLVLYASVGQRIGVLDWKYTAVVRTVLWYSLCMDLFWTAVAYRMRYVPAVDKLRLQAEDPAALRDWYSANLKCLHTSDIVGVHAFFLRLMGAPLAQVLPIYLVASALLLLFFPRRPS